MKNKKFYLTLFVEVIIVLCVILYIFVDMKDVYRFFVGDTTFYPQEQSCDLHVKSCMAKLPENESISFEIFPKDIPLMKPLKFQVKTSEHIRPNSLKLHIYATNMNMGYHSFELKKVSEDTYEATGLLPTCLVGGMIWNAEVIYNSATKSEGGLFTFKTK